MEVDGHPCQEKNMSNQETSREQPFYVIVMELDKWPALEVAVGDTKEYTRHDNRDGGRASSTQAQWIDQCPTWSEEQQNTRTD